MFLQITYDTSQFYFDSQKIHDVITKLRPVLDWWHFLPNVYIIETSTSNEADVANALIKEFQGLRFFVSKIDIDSPNGVLPQKAWNWITKKNKQKRNYVKIKNRKSKEFDDILRFIDGTPAIQKRKLTLLDDLLGMTKNS